MERIWAPWRMEYLLADKADGCILCITHNTASDRDLLILHRTSLSFVMLNRYPYSSGHLMVCPYRHVASIADLTDEELLDMMTSVKLGCSILESVASPDGINVGINMGKAAGAGVDDHLHIHVVPRWNGDTNFMTVISDVRVMPENLLSTYDLLLPAFHAEIGRGV